jgi:hypothetical protein
VETQYAATTDTTLHSTVYDIKVLLPSDVNEATLEQTFLDDYGESIAVYVGQGVLTLKDGRKLNCEFEAGQLSDGEVLLLCSIMPPDPSLCFTTIAAISFDGLTAEGHRIACANRITEINYLPEPPGDGRTAVFTAFRLDEMTVQVTDRHTQAKSARFGVTNFQFTGIAAQQSDDLSCLVLPLTLRHESNQTELSIRPLKHYAKIKRRIKTLRSTAVTCEVISDILQDCGRVRLKEVVDDLCYLLSVARGTRNQWIYCDLYDESGGLVMRTHSSRVTKPYCSLAVIDPRCDGRYETKAFLEQSYSAYVSKRDSYRLNRGTIDAYLDAKAENDYLETRGVKLAVALEMLNAVFVELPDSSAEEFVLDQEDFKKHVQPISAAIDKILEREGVEKNERKAICSEMKIEGLNRRAFRYFIGKLCRQIGLKVEEKEIGLFVECRDKLVHRGRFYCEVATNEERKKYPPLPSKTDEYFFLVNFLDRIFLKLLGYSGIYIDWRVPERSDRSQLV